MKCRERNQKRGITCGTDARHYCKRCKIPVCGSHCRQGIHTRCMGEVGALTWDVLREIQASDAPREVVKWPA